MEISTTYTIHDVYLRDFKEELWVNNKVVREAWWIHSKEAEPLIKQVSEVYSEYNNDKLKEHQSNMIGWASNYRPPYSNGCISWYTWVEPNQSILQKYNVVLPPSCVLKPWYGVKFDLINKSTWLKYVFKGTFPTPELPALKPTELRGVFHALIVDEAGTVLPEVDVYFTTSYTQVKEYCSKHNLEYPVNDHDEEVRMKLWSLVYDINTLQVMKVKGYRVFRVNDRYNKIRSLY